MVLYEKAITKVQAAIIIVVIIAAIIGGVVYYLSTVPMAPPVEVVPEERIIRIGYTAPFTGPAAEFGTNGWYGMSIALEEINERGVWIKGEKYTIDIIRYDDRCDPTEGVANVKRLIIEDKVIAILGSHCSSVCIATVPVIQEHGIPTITIECAADLLTRLGAEYYFRMRPSMPLMAPSIAKIMVEKLGIKSVSFVAVNDDYGRSFVEAFSTELAKYGVPTKTIAYFERGTTDYTPYLTEILADLPDAVMYVGVAVEGGMLLKQAHELGLTGKVKFIGSEEMAGEELIELAGREAAANTYAISLIIYPPDPLCPPEIMKLAEKVKKKYGVPLHYASVFAYDALYVLVKAVEDAQSLDPAAIRDALDKIEYHGLQGLIKFEDFDGYTNQGNYPVHIFMWTEEGTRKYIG